jgi:hypothetical protein
MDLTSDLQRPVSDVSIVAHRDWNRKSGQSCTNQNGLVGTTAK